MLINMRNGLMAGKRLPYDAEVEYLESHGTEWIDTGVTASSAITIEQRVTPLQSNGNPIGGAIKTGVASLSPNIIAYNFDYSSYGITVYLKNKHATAPAPSFPFIFKLQPSIGGFYIDGLFYSVGNDTFDVGYNMYIFVRNRNGSANLNQYAISRLYWYKIWQNSILVHDFQPVRFTNELGVSEGAMYDRANPTVGMDLDGSARTDGLYRNRGTGSFAIGPDI